MTALKNPRLRLIVWGGLGALVVLYVILAASVKTYRAAGLHDPSLVVGEMAKFEFAPAPRQAPQTPFLHDGKTATLADFRGRVALVNFWATWCPPCLKELPSLEALQRALGGENFEVVAIAADPSGPEKAAAFLDRLGVRRLKRYADPRLQLVGAVGGPQALPITILYDRNGREIGRLIGGADWASPEARRLIEQAIAR